MGRTNPPDNIGPEARSADETLAWVERSEAQDALKTTSAESALESSYRSLRGWGVQWCGCYRIVTPSGAPSALVRSSIANPGPRKLNPGCNLADASRLNTHLTATHASAGNAGHVPL